MLNRENQLSTLLPYFSWTVNALPSPETTAVPPSSNGPSTAPQTTASSTAAPTTTPNSGDGTWNGRPLRLVFEDNFSGSGVDTGKWEHEVSLWGGGVSMILLFLTFCLCSPMPSFVIIFCWAHKVANG